MTEAKSSIRGFVLPLLAKTDDNGAIAGKVMKAFPKFHHDDPGYVRKQVADIRWRAAHAKPKAKKAVKPKAKKAVKPKAKKPAPAPVIAIVAEEAPGT